MSALVKIVDGWTLEITGDEPRVRDVDMAERAGLQQPRNIRSLIDRSREELEEFGPLDVRTHCVRTSMPRGGFKDVDVTEYWLTEPQAMTILLQLRTPPARHARVAVVKAFRALRSGDRPAIELVQVPVLSTSPVIGATHRRAELAHACTCGAKAIGVGIHAFHGAVRREYLVGGIYQIPSIHFEEVMHLVGFLAENGLSLPSIPIRKALASTPSAQCDLPFPGGAG